jgi:hypothetical protein
MWQLDGAANASSGSTFLSMDIGKGTLRRCGCRFRTAIKFPLVTAAVLIGQNPVALFHLIVKILRHDSVI